MRIKVGLAAVVLSGLTLMVAACGGSGAGSTSAASTAPSAAGGAAGGQGGMQAYTACLQQNGVTLPSNAARPGGRRSGSPGVRPSGAPGGRPSGRPGGGGAGGGGFGGGFLGSTAPQGVDQATWDKAMAACASVRPSFGAGNGGRDNGAFTAYRTCLSDHGVTIANGQGALNTADPKIAAAVAACAPLRPSGQPGGGGGAPTASS